MAEPAPAGQDFEFDFKRSSEWYQTSDAKDLAACVVSFQTPTGAWPKAVDYTQGPESLGCIGQVKEAVCGTTVERWTIDPPRSKFGS